LLQALGQVVKWQAHGPPPPLRYVVAQARVHNEQANIKKLLSPLQLGNRIGINKLRTRRNGGNCCLAI
jgi:hypothetical protein